MSCSASRDPIVHTEPYEYYDRPGDQWHKKIQMLLGAVVHVLSPAQKLRIIKMLVQDDREIGLHLAKLLFSREIVEEALKETLEVEPQ